MMKKMIKNMLINSLDLNGDFTLPFTYSSRF